MIIKGNQSVDVEVDNNEIMLAALQIYKKSIGRENYAPLSSGWVECGDTSLSFTPYTEDESVIIDMFMENYE